MSPSQSVHHEVDAPPSTALHATNALLDHLRAVLELPVSAPPAPLTRQLVQLAVSHKVDGLLSPSAADEHGAPAADEFLRRLRLASTQRSLRLRMHLRAVLAVFESAGIPVLAFKGSALALQTGRAPAERAGTDVDLLIRPADWVRAHRLLLDLDHEMTGYPEPGHDQRTRYIQWSYNEIPYRHPAGTVDLHWRVVMGHLPAMTADALLADQVVVDDTGAAIPTFHPDAALAHVALHGAKDRWRALRSVVDAHLLLEHGATWDGAQRRVPKGRALPECRAGVGFLRSGEPIPAPAALAAEHERSWAVGVVERPAFEDDGRPTGGTVRFIRDHIRITPNLTSALSVTAQAAVPSNSLTKPEVAPLWWWVCIPARFGRLAKRRGIILGRRLGLPFAPPASG